MFSMHFLGHSKLSQWTHDSILDDVKVWAWRPAINWCHTQAIFSLQSVFANISSGFPDQDKAVTEDE